MRAGIKKYVKDQRIRYQDRGGKHARRNYEKSLTLRNKKQKESRSKRQENTHS